MRSIQIINLIASKFRWIEYVHIDHKLYHPIQAIKHLSSIHENHKWKLVESKLNNEFKIEKIDG